MILDLTDEEGAALLDCIEYYRLADFGCGGNGPSDETAHQHVRDVRSAEHKLLSATKRVLIHRPPHSKSDETRHDT